MFPEEKFIFVLRKMSKRKKNLAIIDSDSDESGSEADYEEVSYVRERCKIEF